MSYVMRDYEQVDVFTPGDSTVHIRARLLCDTVNDLPTPTDIPGFTMEAGSIAWIIGEVVAFMLDTGGAWREQRSADLSAIITDISQIRNDIQTDENRINAAENRITALEAAAALLINDGSKNKLDLTASSSTVGGIQFTINSDGSVTADGINPDKKATGSIMLLLGSFDPEAGVPYIISGCPSGGTINTFALRVATSTDTSVAWDVGATEAFTPLSSDTLSVKCSIKSGVVVDNMTFWPMIDYQAYHNITQDFKSYAPTNRELLDLIHSYHP